MFPQAYHQQLQSYRAQCGTYHKQDFRVQIVQHQLTLRAVHVNSQHKIISNISSNLEQLSKNAVAGLLISTMIGSATPSLAAPVNIKLDSPLQSQQYEKQLKGILQQRGVGEDLYEQFDQAILSKKGNNSLARASASDVAKVGSELKINQRDVKKLQQQLADAQAALDKQTREEALLEQELKKEKAALQLLKKEEAQERAQVSRLEEVLKKGNGQKNAELVKAIEAERAKIKELEAGVGTSVSGGKQLDAFAGISPNMIFIGASVIAAAYLFSNSQMQLKSKRSDEELIAKQTELDSVSSQLKVTQSKLSSSIADVKAAKQAANEKQMRMEQQIQKLNAVEEKVQDKLRKLDSKLKKEQSNAVKLEQKSTDYKAMVSEAQSDYQNIVNERDELQSKMDAIQKELAESRLAEQQFKQLTFAKHQRNQAKLLAEGSDPELEKANKKINELGDDLKKQQLLLKEAIKKGDAAEERYANADKQLNELSAQLASSTKQCTELENERASMSQQVTTLTSQVNQLQLDAKQAEKIFQQQVQGLERTLGGLQSQLDAELSEIASVQNELVTAQLERADAIKQATKLSDQLQLAGEAIVSLEAELVDARTAAANSAAELKAAEQAGETSEETVRCLEEKIGYLNQELIKAQQLLDEKESMGREYDQQLVQVKDQYQQTINMLEEEQGKRLSMDKQMAESAASVAAKQRQIQLQEGELQILKTYKEEIKQLKEQLEEQKQFQAIERATSEQLRTQLNDTKTEQAAAMTRSRELFNQTKLIAEKLKSQIDGLQQDRMNMSSQLQVERDAREQSDQYLLSLRSMVGKQGNDVQRLAKATGEPVNDSSDGDDK